MDLADFKSLSGRGTNFAKRVITRRAKRIRQSILRSSSLKQYLFVVGCQRSGTSMMYKTFERDPEAGVYDEISVLSNRDKIEGLRLNDVDDVLRIMKNNPASLVVAKPLVESQNLQQLLNHFPDSKAIWMFRPYKDVVNSNLKRFGAGNGLSDIEPILKNDTNNWRAENLNQTTRENIIKHIGENTSESDAAALFWFARNSLYFQQQAVFSDKVFLCNYDVLVSNPEKTIKRIYEFLGREVPDTNTQKGINVNSIGKGNSIELSATVEQLCDSMLSRLISSQQN